MARTACSLAIAFAIFQVPLNSVEFYLYDQRIRLRWQPPITESIEIVAIDRETTEKLGRPPNLSELKTVLSSLGNTDPTAIILNLNPSQWVASDQEKLEFAAAVANLPLYVLTEEIPDLGPRSERKLPRPFDSIPLISGPPTADTKIFAKDSVTRRWVYSADEVKFIHAVIAEKINHRSSAEQYQGLFDFYESKQAFINYRGLHAYPVRSFSSFLSSAKPNSASKDLPSNESLEKKIYLLGFSDTSKGEDYVFSPYSRDKLLMPKTELHAHILDTVLHNDAPQSFPNWLNLLVTLLITLLTAHTALTLRPVQGLLAVGGTLVGFSIFGFGAFAFGNLKLDMAHPLLAIFVAYYFFIPYRLIIENRRSWEYQQKNRLLTQVEELKTNFLKMMSHDLKTPLARIQGMAELILREVPKDLSVAHREALTTIRNSSEELSEFIASILNLSRIESKEVKLNLKSRDINEVLATVVRKCEFLALRKNIQVRLELEPLFSLKIDEDLMKQVFTNLLENAIKYSPEGSSILISSEETPPPGLKSTGDKAKELPLGAVWVQVSDQGMGISAEDLPRIFEKFYRTKSVQNGEASGSGIGLYLAKYFVELHGGHISVESELGKGSTFTVEIPGNLG